MLMPHSSFIKKSIYTILYTNALFRFCFCNFIQINQLTDETTILTKTAIAERTMDQIPIKNKLSQGGTMTIIKTDYNTVNNAHVSMI